MKYIALFISLLVCTNVFAEDPVSGLFKGSSEASAIVISGNTGSETYGGKTDNSYRFSELNLGRVFGKFIKTTTGGTETTNAWEAGLRYERTFKVDILSGFVQQKAEADPYNGVFIQRDSADVGVKYTIENNERLNWLGELGVRSSKVYTGTNEYVNFGRLYTEASYKATPNATTKLWLEYLPSFKNSNESLFNTEFSVSVAMNSVLSLKSAMLLNHNEGVVSPLKKDTTTWTTALVANY